MESRSREPFTTAPSCIGRHTCMTERHGSRASKVARHGSAQNPLQIVLRSNVLLVLVCAIPSLITSLLLTFLASSWNPISIPLFDASPTLIGEGWSPVLRWDAVHFVSVAGRGYQYEQQLAFQPGWHGILAVVGRAWQWMPGGHYIEDDILGGSVPSMILLGGIRGCLLFR